MDVANVGLTDHFKLYSFSIINISNRLIELRLHVSVDTKQVISETFFPANLLAYSTEETKPNNKSKQHRHKSLS